MDIEKLIEQLSARGLGNGTSLGYHSGLLDDAATALSTLQAENEKLRVELENYRKGHCSEGGCAAEKDRDAVLAELEQVKRERDAAIEAANGLDKMIGRAWGGRLTMERITQEADFGLEDWEETLFFVKSDPNGAYNIIDIAKYQGEPEFDEILKNVALRLAAIEDILCDDTDEYDLDRLRVLCNQRMTMREEVSQRFSLTAKMPLDRLREIAEAEREGRCLVFPRLEPGKGDNPGAPGVPGPPGIAD